MIRPIITLTTDFGSKDGYVGAVKGVIKRINPHAEIVDITHEIEPFDVWGAAFALNNFYGYFPQDTIHLVVVDPGVGSQRQPLLIQSADFLFVGPDNGVFSFILQNEEIIEIISISNRKYLLSKPSHTFHARDVFAPVTAYLSLGVDIREFGAPAMECSKLFIPQTKVERRDIIGEIIHVDNFGNLITNIEAKSVHLKIIKRIEVKRKRISQIAKSYYDIPEGKIGAVIGSSGFLEIAANRGNAAELVKAEIGTKVKINLE
ncbi:MAG TPA: SAM-dependent chlorinase/fluorinase [candidate division Zixibacteria bacterium]